MSSNRNINKIQPMKVIAPVQNSANQVVIKAPVIKTTSTNGKTFVNHIEAEKADYSYKIQFKQPFDQITEESMKTLNKTLYNGFSPFVLRKSPVKNFYPLASMYKNIDKIIENEVYKIDTSEVNQSKKSNSDLYVPPAIKKDNAPSLSKTNLGEFGANVDNSYSAHSYRMSIMSDAIKNEIKKPIGIVNWSCLGYDAFKYIIGKYMTIFRDELFDKTELYSIDDMFNDIKSALTAKINGYEENETYVLLKRKFNKFNLIVRLTKYREKSMNEFDVNRFKKDSKDMCFHIFRHFFDISFESRLTDVVLLRFKSYETETFPVRGYLLRKFVKTIPMLIPMYDNKNSFCGCYVEDVTIINNVLTNFMEPWVKNIVKNKDSIFDLNNYYFMYTPCTEADRSKIERMHNYIKEEDH